MIDFGGYISRRDGGQSLTLVCRRYSTVVTAETYLQNVPKITRVQIVRVQTILDGRDQSYIGIKEHIACLCPVYFLF